MLMLVIEVYEDFQRIRTWIRGRPVRASSLVSKDSEFNPSVRPSVMEIANYC